MLASFFDEQSVQSTPNTQAPDETTYTNNAFKPLGPITLFNYLTPVSDRTDWYRSIMHIFLTFSREYRYQLTAQDILDVIRSKTNQEYQLDACREDLNRLVKWGNLSTLYDTSRVTTIADFRSPVLLYQATQQALAIEAFIEEHSRIGASEGGLYQGDLPRLWLALQQVDTWLTAGPHTFTPERCQEIAEQWRIAFTTWEKVTNDAAQYLGSMNRSAQQAINIESFIAYKQIVVMYVQSFAQQLVQYSNTIRALLKDWSTTNKKSQLLEIVAATPPPIQALAENQQLWREDVTRQIEALSLWFLREININMFLKAAHDAVEKVVHRARSISDAMRPQTDYVSMLRTLATHMQTIDDLDSARLLFANAFASTRPIHLAEGLAGSPKVADVSEQQASWDTPPTVQRSLKPLYRGITERSAEQPMRKNDGDLNALRQEYEMQLLKQRERFSTLFQHEHLDLGTLTKITPDERQALIEIIDGCLSNNNLEYITTDGTIIKLLNQNEQQFISLQAIDGTLTLPRYRLQCEPSTITL